MLRSQQSSRAAGPCTPAAPPQDAGAPHDPHDTTRRPLVRAAVRVSGARLLCVGAFASISRRGRRQRRGGRMTSTAGRSPVPPHRIHPAFGGWRGSPTSQAARGGGRRRGHEHGGARERFGPCRSPCRGGPTSRRAQRGRRGGSPLSRARHLAAKQGAHASQQRGGALTICMALAQPRRWASGHRT